MLARRGISAMASGAPPARSVLPALVARRARATPEEKARAMLARWRPTPRGYEVYPGAPATLRPILYLSPSALTEEFVAAARAVTADWLPAPLVALVAEYFGSLSLLQFVAAAFFPGIQTPPDDDTKKEWAQLAGHDGDSDLLAWVAARSPPYGIIEVISAAFVAAAMHDRIDLVVYISAASLNTLPRRAAICAALRYRACRVLEYLVPLHELNYEHPMWDSLCEVVARGDAEMLKIVLDRGGGRPANLAKSLARVAGTSGSVEVVQLLLDTLARPADLPDILEKMLAGAAPHGHTAVVTEMFKRGASFADDELRGALRGAAMGGHLAMMRLLRDHGAPNFDEEYRAAVDNGLIDEEA